MTGPTDPDELSCCVCTKSLFPPFSPLDPPSMEKGPHRLRQRDRHQRRSQMMVMMMVILMMMMMMVMKAQTKYWWIGESCWGVKMRQKKKQTVFHSCYWSSDVEQKQTVFHSDVELAFEMLISQCKFVVWVFVFLPVIIQFMSYTLLLFPHPEELMQSSAEV